MEKANKNRLYFRLSKSTEDYIHEFASQNNLTNTAALEQIIAEHQANAAGQNEQVAELLLQKIDEKYGKTFDRIRFASTSAERYAMTLIEMANVFFYASPTGYNFVSTSTHKTQVLEASENSVKEKLASYKQRTDFAKKSGDEK